MAVFKFKKLNRNKPGVFGRNPFSNLTIIIIIKKKKIRWYPCAIYILNIEFGLPTIICFFFFLLLTEDAKMHTDVHRPT